MGRGFLGRSYGSSGGTEEGSVVANRVERGDYRELTANKGYHQNDTELYGGWGR